MSQTCSIKLCQRGRGGGVSSMYCATYNFEEIAAAWFFVKETANCRSIISAELRHEKTGFLPMRKQRQ